VSISITTINRGDYFLFGFGFFKKKVGSNRPVSVQFLRQKPVWLGFFLVWLFFWFFQFGFGSVWFFWF
jgi:hypothetical protein